MSDTDIEYDDDQFNSDDDRIEANKEDRHEERDEDVQIGKRIA